MPPGLGSHLKPEWFKCQPPPPGATTPQFHLEISASDINMEDHQLIIQRGWLLLESSLVLFPVCVPLMLMCSTGRGGRKRAAAENKKEISLVRIICLFLLWDLNTMNPPRIRV